MSEMPVWQVLIMHLPTMFASVAGLVAACAAWRSAASGRKTSERNEGALVVVHELLNGKSTDMEAELLRLRGRIDELEGSNS